MTRPALGDAATTGVSLLLWGLVIGGALYVFRDDLARWFGVKHEDDESDEDDELGDYYVYDKRNQNKVYRVEAPSRRQALEVMSRKLRRAHGEDLRIGNWDDRQIGPERVIRFAW